MRSSKSKWIFIGVALLLVCVVVATIARPRVRQGLLIVRAKASGSLVNIGWLDLFRMVRSGQHFGLPDLVSTPNPFVAIHNPYSAPSDISAGSDLFRLHCALCHGPNGEGGPGGPKLQQRHMVQGNSDWAIYQTISLGIRGTGMPANNLPWLDKWKLVAYVASLGGGPAPEEESASIPVASLPDVSYEAIRDSDRSPTNWLTYSGSYDSHRFSPNNQITTSNVSGLRLLWARQYTNDQPIETSPLVVNGYMFVTLPPNRVEALNAKTGALIWAYERDVPADLRLCCGIHNRGLAVLGNTLYFGSLDAHLTALDIHTGRVVWDVQIADYKVGYSITGAPLALKNMIVTGVACGEFGARGFIDALDPATGKEIWRFYTIPQQGQPGAETWGGNSAQTGGGPAWLTGSYDPTNNVIYWPIGNPSPDYDGSARPGDNLYTNSVVALDADHGTLLWHFQFSPHDVFDWDAAQTLILFDGSINGKNRSLLAQADRNGFFYLLDAQTGAFLLGKPFMRETWADGIDSNGRPRINPDAQPTERGTAVYPGVAGAVNWESPSYSPMTRLMYVPALDRGGVFTAAHTAYHQGDFFLGGSFEFFAGNASQAAVRAIDPITGEVKWEYRNPATTVGGLLSTGGGLLFGSQDENFFALDAQTGREIWHLGTGGRVVAAPITFLNDGKQTVTVAAGHVILTFGL